MSDLYRPPYTITPAMLRLVGEIGEWIGRYFVAEDASLSSRLRRGNRIRTIHASLAIENNTLTLEQVAAVLDGKRVMGLPREIQEVRNAFAAYEGIDRWVPTSQSDLLEAHGALMAGLVDRPGEFRGGNMGVFHGDRVVHMAPPADRVQSLMTDLLTWLPINGEIQV
jgi:Fic family protein